MIERQPEIVKLNDCPMPLSYITKKYNVSRTTLWRWRNNGLKFLKVGKKVFVRESALIDLMEKENAMKQA